MRFIEILKGLRIKYLDDCTIRTNGTILLGIKSATKCRHMIFGGLKQEYIDEYLISNYRLIIPKEYINLLKYSNGVNLFWVRLKYNDGVEFSYSMMSIYGLPLTKPFERPFNLEEPFDLRVEDLARHEGIPQYWLKCGSYIRDNNFHRLADIFVDTLSGRAYSCYKNDSIIIDEWASLDECLCCIWRSLKYHTDVYEITD